MDMNVQERKKAFLKQNDGQLHIRIRSLGMLFFIFLFFLPNAFGIRIGIVLNAQRVMTVVLLLAILTDRERRRRFFTIVLGNRDLLFFAAFVFVCFYTMVLRVNLGSFFNPLMDTLLAYFLTIYLLRYEISTEKLLQLIRVIGLILCIIGVIEMITKVNIFSYIAFQKDMFSGGGFRDGGYRIAVNGQHPLGYGLFLLLLFPLNCFDTKRGKLDALCRPLLSILILINVYATGSRSTLGILVLEFVIILLLSRREELCKLLVIIGPIAVMCAILLFLFWDYAPIQSLLVRAFNTIDGALGTHFAEELFNYHSFIMKGSTDYRTKLPKIFLLDWLNPIVGRGLAYHFSAYIEDVAVRSIDNYYVLLFIQYAYPGLFAFLALCISQIRYAVSNILRYNDYLSVVVLVSLIGYFVNLWFVDNLGTLKFVFVLFGMLYVRANGGRK